MKALYHEPLHEMTARELADALGVSWSCVREGIYDRALAPRVVRSSGARERRYYDRARVAALVEIRDQHEPRSFYFATAGLAERVESRAREIRRASAEVTHCPPHAAADLVMFWRRGAIPRERRITRERLERSREPFMRAGARRRSVS